MLDSCPLTQLLGSQIRAQFSKSLKDEEEVLVLPGSRVRVMKN